MATFSWSDVDDFERNNSTTNSPTSDEEETINIFQDYPWSTAIIAMSTLPTLGSLYKIYSNPDNETRSMWGLFLTIFGTGSFISILGLATIDKEQHLINALIPSSLIAFPTLIALGGYAFAKHSPCYLRIPDSGLKQWSIDAVMTNLSIFTFFSIPYSIIKMAYEFK